MTTRMHSSFELGEVKLKVSDLKRSISFYQSIVGFKILRQEGKQAFLSADGVKTLLVLEELPNAIVTPPRTTSGLYHFAILLPTRQALGLSLRRLIDKGIPIGQADHLVSEALYISDPDHNGIEIYIDRPRDSWEHDLAGHVKMASDPLDLDGLLEDAKDIVWEGLPLGTTIGHVHLHVSDLAKSRHFYCDLLGFDLMADWPGALFISAGGYHHHLGLNVWAGVGAPMPSANGTGLSYYTMVIPEQGELAKIVKRLEDAGIAIQEKNESWVIKDPSGIEINLRGAL